MSSSTRQRNSDRQGGAVTTIRRHRPAVFEPILFPLSGPGRAPSIAVDDKSSFVLAGSSTAYFAIRFRAPAVENADASAQLTTTPTHGDMWSTRYAARRERADFASRIRDTSRAAQTAGTEVPIVHERDFRGQLRIIAVPVDARFRTTLRLWRSMISAVIVFGRAGIEHRGASLVTPIPGTSMFFGSADLTSLLPQGKNHPLSVSRSSPRVSRERFRRAASSIWGMLSITTTIRSR